MSDWHDLATAGRFVCRWHQASEVIELRSEVNRLWKYQLEDDAGIAELDELLMTFNDLTTDEMRFLVGCIRSVETWLEHCPHDLAEFGQVGVSC